MWFVIVQGTAGSMSQVVSERLILLLFIKTNIPSRLNAVQQ